MVDTRLIITLALIPAVPWLFKTLGKHWLINKYLPFLTERWLWGGFTKNVHKVKRTRHKKKHSSSL